MTLQEACQAFKDCYLACKKYPGDYKYKNYAFYSIILLATKDCNDLSLKARVELLDKGYSAPPLCRICGLKLSRWWDSWGYFTCSQKCAHKAAYIYNKEAIEAKRKQSCLDNLGVDNPMKNPEVAARVSAAIKLISKDIQVKAEATNLFRYGARRPMQSSFIKERLKARSQASLGVNHPNASQQVIEQRRRTCFAKLGLSTTSKGLIKEVYDKLISKEFWNEEYAVKGKSILQIANELGIKHASTPARYFWKYADLELRRSNESSGELQLTKFIAQFKEVQKKYLLPHEGPGAPRSLDIYIPELKLAFEYNGLYWHSEKYRSQRYHLQKTLACSALGIRLIHIWEDDWLFKEDLMKRKIKALLGLEEQKVFARKCSIIVPTKEQKRIFYEQNHMKGSGAGSIDYALSYQDELVAMITFKSMGQGVFDLNRFATSCSVPGGFSRLLEHFKRNQKWFKIYTYADRSWSQGNVYLKCGFKLAGKSEPTYHGVEDYQRKSHEHYTHNRLAQRFPDLHGTQFQIMDQAGIPRIWDCGQLKFELDA